MRGIPRRVRAAGLLALLIPLGALAGPKEDHQALADLLQEASRAESDPAVCDSYLSSASSRAQSLASLSCTTGYSVHHIHGVLISIRGLLKVGNVLFHRHGCADHAKDALGEARDILVNTPLSCMSGDERMASIAGMEEAFLNASGLANQVPASLPDLYPPPPGGPPVSNHCISEQPNLASVYAAARAYVDTQISPPATTAPGGAVTCDPDDPTNIWQVAVKVNTGGPGPPTTQDVTCDISTMTCN